MTLVKQYYIYKNNNAVNMSYVKIWVHVVFSTKNRYPFLTKDIRYEVFNHIIENCREKDIYLQSINGFTDHIFL